MLNVPKICQKIFLLLSFAGLFFVNAVTLADSKQTDKTDTYCSQEEPNDGNDTCYMSYTAGDTIRISTNTSIDNDSVQISGFYSFLSSS